MSSCRRSSLTGRRNGRSGGRLLRVLDVIVERVRLPVVVLALIVHGPRPLAVGGIVVAVRNTRGKAGV